MGASTSIFCAVRSCGVGIHSQLLPTEIYLMPIYFVYQQFPGQTSVRGLKCIYCCPHLILRVIIIYAKYECLKSKTAFLGIGEKQGLSKKKIFSDWVFKRYKIVQGFSSD